MISALFIGKSLITENSDEAKDLFNTSRFGALLADGRVELSMLEGLYLIEKRKIEVLDGRSQVLDASAFERRASRGVKGFRTKYSVFRDLRKRGYIVKTALKFGADFRVYDRGVKPGEDHARWVVYPVHESEYTTWNEFAAKNRVAHSTKKKLLIAVVDDEGDVSYWESRWVRP